jgi:DNA (cytosine-5)-methyltransferase 1
MSRKYKVGSLFAGIGGIDLGFAHAQISDDEGYELVWANEIDRYACETYRNNFKHFLIEGDINKVLHPDQNIESNLFEKEYYESMNRKILENDIDIITGGFPCQAFSIAGEMKGFEDERGNLFWSIVHLVRELGEAHRKPRILFLENVKNLIAHDKGRTYKVIKGEIEKLGYIVKEKVLNTMHISALPQNRERIYIVCFLEKMDADKFTMFDEIDKYIMKPNKADREQAIKEILDYSGNVPEKYYYNRAKYPNYFMDLDSQGKLINLDQQVTEMYQFYQLRRGMYVRKNKSNVCPTLTANMGTGGHNVPLVRNHNGVRKITPIEALKLQGFPIGNGYKLPVLLDGKPYADCHLYKQAGNAVSVPVIKIIAEELLKVMIENDKLKLQNCI